MAGQPESSLGGAQGTEDFLRAGGWPGFRVGGVLMTSTSESWRAERICSIAPQAPTRGFSNSSKGRRAIGESQGVGNVQGVLFQ